MNEVRGWRMNEGRKEEYEDWIGKINEWRKNRKNE